MATELTADTSHVMPRISWGAIFGGAFVAFVSMLVLNTLGVAVGLSGDATLGIGSAIWAILVALISLFMGGWVMSRSIASETKSEAAIHGIVLWGVLSFGLIMLAVSGVQFGLSTIMGASIAVSEAVNIGSLSGAMRELGLSEEQTAQLQQRLQAMNIEGAQSAWWAFAGMLVSLGAVVAGAYSGGRLVSERSRAGFLRSRQTT